MPRKKTQTTGKKPDTATAIEQHSQGAVSAKKAASKNQGGAIRRRYGGNRALRDALAKGGTRAEIVSEVDRLYAEYGSGTPNDKGARATVDIALPILRESGVIDEARGRPAVAQAVMAGYTRP